MVRISFVDLVGPTLYTAMVGVDVELQNTGGTGVGADP